MCLEQSHILRDMAVTAILNQIFAIKVQSYIPSRNVRFLNICFIPILIYFVFRPVFVTVDT